MNERKSALNLSLCAFVRPSLTVIVLMHVTLPEISNLKIGQWAGKSLLLKKEAVCTAATRPGRRETAFPSPGRVFWSEGLSLTPALSRWERENFRPMVGDVERRAHAVTAFREIVRADSHPPLRKRGRSLRLEAVRGGLPRRWLRFGSGH
jgi:hypothetical protein